MIMATTEKLSGLIQILALTKSMREKADNALWEELVELEQQREQLIMPIFPISNTDFNPELRRLTEEVIKENTMLEEVCQQAKKELKTQVLVLNKNKTAIAAYGSK